MIWMTPRRFEWTLRSRGTALATWSDRDRLAALRLLRHSPAARMALADMLALDDGSDADPAALTRMQTVVHQALRPPTALARVLRCGAIAACVAAGLYLGLPVADADGAFPAGYALGPTMQSPSPATVLATLDE